MNANYWKILTSKEKYERLKKEHEMQSLLEDFHFLNTIIMRTPAKFEVENL